MAIEPTLAELISEAHDSRLLDVHVSLPGKVKSYDRVTQTAEVEPMVQRPVLATDGSTVFEDLPVITNVRVAWPRGGGYSLQWPLNSGDFGDLVFPTFDPSQWRTTGTKSEPAFLGLHVLGQPWFWPGAGPMTAPLVPPVGDEAVFEIGGTLRLGGLTSDFVALATKVQAYISQLESDISGALFAVGVGSAASGTAAQTAFDGGGSARATLATAIAALKVKAE